MDTRKMNIREVTMNDYKILLIWRNDIDTRKNSHSMEPISEEKHKQWLSNVIDNVNRTIYLFEINHNPVGTGRIDYDGELYELSWTVSPDYRGQGLGKQMVSRLVTLLEGKKIRAEVKKSNIPSIKICEYVGMKFEKEENGILHYFRNTNG